MPNSGTLPTSAFTRDCQVGTNAALKEKRYIKGNLPQWLNSEWTELKDGEEIVLAAEVLYCPIAQVSTRAGTASLLPVWPLIFCRQVLFDPLKRVRIWDMKSSSAPCFSRTRFTLWNYSATLLRWREKTEKQSDDRKRERRKHFHANSVFNTAVSSSTTNMKWKLSGTVAEESSCPQNCCYWLLSTPQQQVV